MLNLLLVLPVIAIVAIAIFISVSSVLENIRFARTTGQIITIVAAVRDYTDREKRSTFQQNEDLLASLQKSGAISDAVKNGNEPAHLENSWGGTITAQAVAPTMMRLEVEVPVRDCRHLASFFVDDADSVGLRFMEAREGTSPAWRRFLDSDDKMPADNQSIEAACGTAQKSILALGFALH